MRPATSDIGVSSGSVPSFDDRLVGDARDLSLEHLLGQLELGCEMQISEQQLVLAHPRIFRCDRLLDLDDHVARLPDLIRRIEKLAAGLHILLVRKARAFARRLLHINVVPGMRQRLHARRRQPDAIFVVLDLFW